MIDETILQLPPALSMPTVDEMGKYYRGERMHAYSMGWNAVEFGLLPGNLVLISGYGNNGKGTFIRQAALQMNILHGIKWAFWAPEDSPAEYFYGDLIHTYTGKSTEKNHENYISEPEYWEAFRIVSDIVKLMDFVEDIPTVEQILLTFEHYLQRYSCRGLVIDPFNNSADMNAAERDDRIVRNVCLAAKNWLRRHNDCFVVIVVHPKAPNGTKSGEDPKCPTYNDLHYGSDWSKFADDILMYHHPTFNTNKENCDRIFSPSKIKKQKISGVRRDYSMNWNYKQNRIYDSNYTCVLPTITSACRLQPHQLEIEDNLPF